VLVGEVLTAVGTNVGAFTWRERGDIDRQLDETRSLEVALKIVGARGALQTMVQARRLVQTMVEAS
jgi:hypothetical protein